LHRVLNALSRMYEGDDSEDTVTTAIGAINLVTKDIVDVANMQDEWYRKRYKKVVSSPKRFKQWKVIDDQLYFLKSKPVVSKIVKDLDRWKLVLPMEWRREERIARHPAGKSLRNRKDISTSRC